MLRISSARGMACRPFCTAWVRCMLSSPCLLGLLSCFMVCLHYLTLFLLLLLFPSQLFRVLSLSFMLLLPPQTLLLLVLCVFGAASLFLLQVVEC